VNLIIKKILRISILSVVLVDTLLHFAFLSPVLYFSEVSLFSSVVYLTYLP